MTFRIPNFPEPNSGSDYNVPQYSGIELLSAGRSAALSAIYGVGVRAAEANLVRNSIKDNDYNVSSSVDYNPDAQETPSGFRATDRWDGKMSSSLIGMPVMCYLKFIGGTYIDLQGNSITIEDVILETVVLKVTIRKNNKRLTVNGRDHDITEFIGLSNFDVEIRTIITADAPVNQNIQKRGQLGVYPRDNMDAITKVLLAPISIPVECWYLQQFGINFLVIDDGIEVEQMEGRYSEQVLVIPTYSDKPLIIKILQ